MNSFEQAIPLPEILVSEVLERGSGATLITHGPEHWRRVANNGLHLLRQMIFPNAAVGVFLFSLFHDSMRENEHTDDGHGDRGAMFFLNTVNQWPEGFNLFPRQKWDVAEACALHTDQQLAQSSEIGVAWDADRLDLMRVDKQPDPDYLNTDLARRSDFIEEAVNRTWEEPPTWKELYEAYSQL